MKFLFSPVFVNIVVVLLHFLGAWILILLGAKLARWIFNLPPLHWKGLWALGLTLVWLGIGWFNAHVIRPTEYELTTDKAVSDTGRLRIVGLSDAHVGAVFSGKDMEKYVAEINELKPDAVVIMGDLVDDDTSLQDMQDCCKSLGGLKSRYGTFMAWGNHDCGYFSSGKRGYSIEDLQNSLESNGISILRDTCVRLREHFILGGRADGWRDKDRKSAEDLYLASGAGEKDYVVLLDHVPNDFNAEAAAGFDLVLSGHTHGGQFLGLGPVGIWMGANDAYYGHERREATDFVISSGIGNWAFKFRTGCVSEYIVVDIVSSETE